MKDKEGNEVKLVFVGRKKAKTCSGCVFDNGEIFCPEDEKGKFICNKLFTKFSVWKRC